MRRNNKVYKLSKGETVVMTIGTTFSGTSDVPSYVEIVVNNFFGRFRITVDDFRIMLPDFIGYIGGGGYAEVQCKLSTTPDEICHIRFSNHTFYVITNHLETLISGEFDTITNVSDTTYL